MSAEVVTQQTAQQPPTATPEPIKRTQLLYLIGCRVLVRPAEAPETIGNVVVPDAVRDEHRLLEGDVLMVGPDVRQVRTSDRAIYGAFNGQKIVVNGEELLVLNEDEVLAAWRFDEGLGGSERGVGCTD